MSKQEELTATEKFMKDINTVFSQHCSNLISEATKRGILNRAQSGYAVTRLPLGYSTTETPGLFKVNRHGKAIRETLKRLANGEMNIESATLN